VKVLLACDGVQRLYTEALARAIRTFRSYVEVAVIDMGELETEVDRFHPQLVIVSGASIPPNPVDLQLLGHIELSPKSEPLSRFRVGERFWEATNPTTLGEIFTVVDEVQVLYSTFREQEKPMDTDDEEEA